jgi:hypothetical protein
MVDEILSTTSHHFSLGNKYPSHAYISRFQPCVGCFLACNVLLANDVLLAQVFKENIYIAFVILLR